MSTLNVKRLSTGTNFRLQLNEDCRRLLQQIAQRTADQIPNRGYRNMDLRRVSVYIINGQLCIILNYASKALQHWLSYQPKTRR